MQFREDRDISRIKKSLRAAALLLMFGAALAAAACKGSPQASTKGTGPGEPRPVKVARVADVAMERTIPATGTLAAYEQATVSAKVPGRVQSISVDLGTVVKQGQVIAQIEQQDYKLRLEQAEAALSQARARVGLSPDGKDERVNPEDTGTVRQARAQLDEAKLKYDRAISLSQQGVISRAQLDSAEAEHKVALSRYQDAVEEIRNRQALVLQRRSELESARQQLADSTIAAPFGGVIQEKRANNGEYVTAGSPIVNLVRMDPLRLRVEVPEREAHSVKMGQVVRVTVEGDTNVYAGHIARLSPTITAQNRILVAEAEVRNDGQLRPGSFARAEIVSEDGTSALAVPINSIVVFAGIEKVLTIQDGKALEKQITSGRRNGDWAEIVSGLNKGDVVVVNPGNLQSGQPVKVEE